VTSRAIGIIAGTGLADRLTDSLDDAKSYANTKILVGDQVVPILYFTVGRLNNLEIVVIPRHGPTRDVPDRGPAELIIQKGHEAHLLHMHHMGVSAIYAFNSVGAIDRTVPLASELTFLVPDQIARGFSSFPHSLGKQAKKVHPSMHKPFGKRERAVLIDAAARASAKTIDHGLYIQSVGDCFETAAEISAYKLLYADYRNRVVGMTAGAEASLAQQLQIPYALICANCNWAEGTEGAAPVDHELVLEGMRPAAVMMDQIAENVMMAEASHA